MAILLGCPTFQVVAGFVLVPRYAMLGAAVANLLTAAGGVAVAGWLVRSRFGGLVEIGRVLRATGLSRPLGVLLWAWPHRSTLALPEI